MSFIESGENMMDNTKTSNGSMTIYEIEKTGYNDMIYAIPVSKRKFKVRDYCLDRLKDDKFIQDNFNLNIKRLNKWWYSVYFDPKG